MKLEFIGAAHEVTGSCHFLQIGDIYNLITGRCLQIGTIQPAKKKTKTLTGVFARLVVAAERRDKWEK